MPLNLLEVTAQPGEEFFGHRPTGARPKVTVNAAIITGPLLLGLEAGFPHQDLSFGVDYFVVDCHRDLSFKSKAQGAEELSQDPLAAFVTSRVTNQPSRCC